MTIECDVLIIGGGISGLTTAFHLTAQGLRVLVLEAGARAGGVIASERFGEVLVERGPNSALDANPRIGELISALGLTAERIETNPVASRRYVVRAGRLVALPTSPASLASSALFSLPAKLRLLREPFIRPGAADDEETVTRFIERRLGREVLDYAVEPFVAGIYAGNPDELSMGAAFPRLRALEQQHGSLLRGQIARLRERRRSRQAPVARPSSFTFRDGLQTLTDALAQRLGDRMRLGERARRLTRAGSGGFLVTTEGKPNRYSARAVVLAVPARSSATLLRELTPGATAALEEIAYAPVVSVALAYARGDVAHPLDGFGFLVPRVENRKILGTLFSSSMFEGRAPVDTALLTTFVGGQRQPDLTMRTDGEVIALVQGELTQLLGVSGSPRHQLITRWDEAIPQYNVGHLDRLERATAVERILPGVFLAGSYRGGVSLGDCIQWGSETAARVGRYAQSERL